MESLRVEEAMEGARSIVVDLNAAKESTRVGGEGELRSARDEQVSLTQGA